MTCCKWSRVDFKFVDQHRAYRGINHPHQPSLSLSQMPKAIQEAKTSSSGIAGIISECMLLRAEMCSTVEKFTNDGLSHRRH